MMVTATRDLVKTWAIGKCFPNNFGKNNLAVVGMENREVHLAETFNGKLGVPEKHVVRAYLPEGIILDEFGKIVRATPKREIIEIDDNEYRSGNKFDGMKGKYVEALRRRPGR